MSEDDNHLIIECLRVGVYDLHLSWRPESEETKRISEQESRNGETSSGQAPNHVDGGESPSNAATAVTKPETTSTTLTKSVKTDIKRSQQDQRTSNAANTPATDEELPSQNPSPPVCRPARPLYSLEVYEAAPVAGWRRRYHGAGTRCRLERLRSNVPHRVRVRSETGVSQVRRRREGCKIREGPRGDWGRRGILVGR